MNELRKKFGFVLSFLPWLMLGVISKFSFTVAVIVSFLTSLLCFNRIRKGFIIDCATFVFILTSLILVLFFKNMWFAKRMIFFGFSSLTIVAWGSILIRYPFTINYAKLRVPKENWNTYFFLHVNYIISTTFAITFSLLTFLQFIKIYIPNLFHPIFFPLIYSLIIVSNFIYISWFPEWYKKRYKEKFSKK